MKTEQQQSLKLLLEKMTFTPVGDTIGLDSRQPQFLGQPLGIDLAPGPYKSWLESFAPASGPLHPWTLLQSEGSAHTPQKAERYRPLHRLALSHSR